MQVHIQYIDGLGEINMLKNYEENTFPSNAIHVVKFDRTSSTIL